MMHLFIQFIMLLYQFFAFTIFNLTTYLFSIPHQFQVTLIHRFNTTFLLILDFQTANMNLKSLVCTHDTLEWFILLQIVLIVIIVIMRNFFFPITLFFFFVFFFVSYFYFIDSFLFISVINHIRHNRR